MSSGFPTTEDDLGLENSGIGSRGIVFSVKLHSYSVADLRLCFRICKDRFSHDAAHSTYCTYPI